jgi:hypothetical protein
LGVGGEVPQTMYTHDVSEYKNDKIKGERKKLFPVILWH